MGNALRNGSMTTDEFVGEAGRLGFGSVELCDRTVTSVNADAIGALLLRCGMTCPSFAVRNDFTVVGKRAEELEHVLQGVMLARVLGARIVRVWTGTSSTSREARENVSDLMRVASAATHERGLRLAIETHGGLSNDAAFMARLCAEAGAGTGVCLDFGNVAPAPRRPAAIRRFAPLTTHVHVKSYAFLDDGRESSFDLHDAIRHLIASGYRGLWVCEYEGTEKVEAGIIATATAVNDAITTPSTFEPPISTPQMAH